MCVHVPVVVAGVPLLLEWELDVSLAHSLSTILFPPSVFSGKQCMGVARNLVKELHECVQLNSTKFLC